MFNIEDLKIKLVPTKSQIRRRKRIMKNVKAYLEREAKQKEKENENGNGN